jgi:hypothetical protein
VGGEREGAALDLLGVAANIERDDRNFVGSPQERARTLPEEKPDLQHITHLISESGPLRAVHSPRHEWPGE